VEFIDDPEVQGLRVVLSDAENKDDAASSVAAAQSQPISAAQTAKLLARLPQLEEEHGDRKVFALREGSLPAPRTGETVDVSFPPKPEVLPPDPTEQDDLTVVRFAPEGSVPLAPKLSVSFNQPMVAVTSQDEAAKTKPVRIDPEPHGQWRWIGTKTVLFEPDPRFPMSTDYKIEVPAGTKSATGGVLDEAKSWTFDTPTTAFVQQWPSGGPVDLEPNIFMSFNQAIDSVAIWERLTLVGGDKKWKIVQLTEAEIAEDKTIKQLVEGSEPGRWMAFRSTETLDRATWYSVTIEAGPISAEGPKPTPSALSFGFMTYEPLKIVEHRCGWGPQACPPHANWWVSFNNQLDPKVFSAKSLEISPEITDPIHIYPSGSAIYFDGRKPGSRKYTVTVPAGTTDIYGQTLGKDADVTFNVGKDQPSLSGTGSPMIVLDPDASPAMTVYSTNHQKLRLRVYRVGPDQWVDLSKWWEKHNNDWYHRADLPGTRLTDKIVQVGGDVDSMVETAIDLQPYLKDGYGQLLVWVTPTRPPKDAWNRQEVIHWVQRTDLGLTAFHDRDKLRIWANALADGASAADVSLQLHGSEVPPISTDDDGMATLKLDGGGDRDLLVARRGEDMALLPQSNAFWRGGGWYPYSPSDTMRWFVFDDRGMYKPGETVTVKGWMRKFEHGPTGDIASVSTDKVTWELRGPRGNELLKGETDVSEMGGFDLSFELPGNVNLGYAQLYLRTSVALGGTTHTHQVQIQEFRRPEFEVSATVDPGHHILGEHVHASVDAHYYAGGGLPNAETSWYAYSSPATYVPPNRSEYAFGRWTPWWGGYFWSPPTAGSPGANHSTKTDVHGVHDLDVHLESLNPARPMTLNLQASVIDVNRQQWTATTSMLVHPSALYIGLKAEKQFIQPGAKFEIDAIVSDIDGEIVPGQDMDLKLHRLEWGTDDDGVWGMQITDEQTCALTSLQAAARCSLGPDKSGQYEIIARVIDSEGRANESTLRLWVAGSKQPPNRGVGQDQVTLIPSGKEFSDGDVAEIFVQAPFAPAEGMLTYRRSGILHSERFRMDGATTTLQIPIREAHVPNLYVQVDLVGKKERTTDEGEPVEGIPPRPAYASGSINLPIPPLERTLSVTAAPRVDALQPGGSTEIDVTVVDAQGKPVSGGEVVVAVVDESVLALSGYQLADPIGIFYAQRGPDVSDYHLRSQIILASAADVGRADASRTRGGEMDDFGEDEGGGRFGDVLKSKPRRRPASGSSPPPPPAVATKSEVAQMPMEEKSKEVVAKLVRGNLKKDANKQADQTAADRNMPTTAIALRTDFSALALFKPDLATNAEGKVTVPVKLPDSLTRYRIMVVAAHGENAFGKGESGITARNPVMVRPSPPRFLNFGDRAELPVVIQNQTDKPVSVDVAMRATNAILIDRLPADPKTVDVAGKAEAGQRITVPANNRVEVRFPVAADMAGTARFQLAVAAGDFADATEISLPVWTPATTEAFATYGEIDDGSIVQPVAAPPDVWTQFGGLEVTTSSTALQALTDAVIYLSNYPFSCNEQLSSRVLAIAALRDVLDAFDAEGLPESKALEAQVVDDLDQLRGRQNHDGGFGFWKRGDPSWPYLSIHVAHAASRAEEKGFTLDQNMRYRMLSYLQNVESYIPHTYGLKYRRTLIAYALYTRERLGDHDGARARKLFADAGMEGPDSLSLEAQGWLLHVLAADKADDVVAQIERNWMNKVSETAAAAHFVTGYGDDAAHVLLHSDRRADGVLLEALVKIKPENALIPKVVRGLLAHRKRGRWGNTQENAFVLVAMDAYFHKFEGTTPDFIARAWLGEGFAGEHTFEGRTTERARIDIPMGYLTEKKGNQDLILQKDGAGRMYYRIGMRYAPRDLRLDPADRGFTVERSYEAVDDPADVVRKDGIWHVKAGAKVRIRVTMVATGRRYHVALVDPLPAGFEAMNPALAVTGALPPDPTANQGRYWWWSRTWYEHENLRDERVEAFTSLLWDGVHEYTYVARATTPGQFVVPPPKAEEMYHPETFGRGATTRVVVY